MDTYEVLGFVILFENNKEMINLIPKDVWSELMIKGYIDSYFKITESGKVRARSEIAKWANNLIKQISVTCLV